MRLEAGRPRRTTKMVRREIMATSPSKVAARSEINDSSTVFSRLQLIIASSYRVTTVSSVLDLCALYPLSPSL